MSEFSVRAHAETHEGNVREANEDSFVVEPELGLYAVFDGMGGHNAGDVASRQAREVVTESIRAGRASIGAEQLLSDALDAASASIYREARRRRDFHGMGTTAVACLIEDNSTAVIAHSGDSRAYLLREGRMRQLTRDHTVVAELMSRGALSQQEAMNHPYASVLSRNLGGKTAASADVQVVELQAGDRLMLCSDGLTGYASRDAVEHVLSGAEEPRAAAIDLVDLALRGGGGDNVTTVVIEVGDKIVPEATQILRTSGASAWWEKRELFLTLARDEGLANSPICSVLSEDEAIQIVAGNLCEAIYHDLEQTTGIHVWTFSENLAKGWFDQGGEFAVLASMLDLLCGCAEAVFEAIHADGVTYAATLEAAVVRALVVAEMAVGGVLAERIRRSEAELIKRRAPSVVPSSATSEEKTIPFFGAVRVVPPPPAVAECLDGALDAVYKRLASFEPHEQTSDVVGFAHRCARDFAGEQDMIPVARDLFGSRELTDIGFQPLIESLDQARVVHSEAVKAQPAEPEVLAAAVRRIAAAHHSLSTAVAFLVIDAAQPVTEILRQTTERTAQLRSEVSRNESAIAAAEKTVLDREGFDG